MSLDHQLPVLVKKAPMNDERAHCGLTSLLPMTCRERAEAFAQSLHTRLRNLGVEECRHESQHFIEFDIDCESPSSPTNEYQSSQDDDPFYETTPIISAIDHEDMTKARTSIETHLTNGFRENGSIFTNPLYSDRSPIRSQPIPREASDHLFSAINLNDCAKCDYLTEQIDTLELKSSSSCNLNNTQRSRSSTPDDSDFESAKSEILDSQDEVLIQGNRLKATNEQASNIVDEGPKLIHIDTVDSETKCDTDNIPNINDAILDETSIECTNIETASIDTESSEGERPQRVRRCSSLKTGKTPPGTPGRKKIVRFADVLGLDLADVKTFMDEIPVIPKSAYDDLANADIVVSSPPTKQVPKFGEKILVPLFQPRREIADVLDRQNVCLESATVAGGASITICGSVRVRNLDFHKTVHIRYTLDHWRTYTDLQASYVQGSCDGYSDRFQFLIYAPSITVGQRLELAIRFQCKGVQYWDSNSETNYCFECLPLGSSPSSALPPADNWQRSFY